MKKWYTPRGTRVWYLSWLTLWRHVIGLLRHWRHHGRILCTLIWLVEILWHHSTGHWFHWLLGWHVAIVCLVWCGIHRACSVICFKRPIPTQNQQTATWFICQSQWPKAIFENEFLDIIFRYFKSCITRNCSLPNLFIIQHVWMVLKPCLTD